MILAAQVAGEVFSRFPPSVEAALSEASTRPQSEFIEEKDYLRAVL